MKSLVLILSLVLMLSACGHTAKEGNSGSRNAACFVDGQTRENGTKWKDSCNTCWCNDGKVSCTLLGCTP